MIYLFFLRKDGRKRVFYALTIERIAQGGGQRLFSLRRYTGIADVIGGKGRRRRQW